MQSFHSFKYDFKNYIGNIEILRTYILSTIFQFSIQIFYQM